MLNGQTYINKKLYLCPLRKLNKSEKVLRKILFITLFVFSIGNIEAQTTSDSIVMNYLKEMGAPVTYNNEVKLLMTGHDKFVDLFENIRHARHHIHLEYFNFRNDSIANALFSLTGREGQGRG